jgi:hypothetical protein
MTTLSIILISALGGGLVTAGGIIALDRSKVDLGEVFKGQADIISQVGKVSDQVAQGQLDVQRNLTAPDLIEYACSKEGLEANPLVCREMFCRMQQRGIDSKTGDECEEITNVINSLEILKACDGRKDGEYTACIRIFEKRK